MQTYRSKEWYMTMHIKSDCQTALTAKGRLAMGSMPKSEHRNYIAWIKNETLSAQITRVSRADPGSVHDWIWWGLRGHTKSWRPYLQIIRDAAGISSAAPVQNV
jgi:hypothetical protein